MIKSHTQTNTVNLENNHRQTSRILRVETMDIRLMYMPNEDKHKIMPRSKLIVKKSDTFSLKLAVTPLETSIMIFKY